MKRLYYLSIPLFLLLVLSSCRKEDEHPEITNTLKNGSWEVASFYHVDHDETEGYEGYKITFTQLETVSASGTNFYTGKWIITTEGDLQMDFGNTFRFERFNAKWHIVNYNDQVIQLDIVDGTDHLVLQKIQ